MLLLQNVPPHLGAILKFKVMIRYEKNITCNTTISVMFPVCDIQT